MFQLHRPSNWQCGPEESSERQLARQWRPQLTARRGRAASGAAVVGLVVGDYGVVDVESGHVGEVKEWRCVDCRPPPPPRLQTD